MATPRCGIGTRCFLDERSKHLSNSLLIDERNKDALLDVFSVNFDRCDVMKCSRDLHTFVQGTQPLAKEVTSDVPYQIIQIPHLLRSMSRFTKMFKSSYGVLRSIEPAWKNCEPFLTIIDDQRTIFNTKRSAISYPEPFPPYSSDDEIADTRLPLRSSLEMDIQPGALRHLARALRRCPTRLHDRFRFRPSAHREDRRRLRSSRSGPHTPHGHEI
ncbi:hypothetical protein BDN70DRAFT_885959 [Pholiota conissans]|uniref:Uncharacterized protein n=1 Tax=Pholiota conissans TaxID=109636 RepID=A0A9P6CNB6_9AGAR|nr:hypothetical protein BDN70DRAFT_885959 [Pholiota conissans]